jgi:hypothetical protein
MNINDVYTLVQYITNKNQQGYVTPSQFNTVINQAQKSYVSYLLGSFQSYTPGRPVARVEFGQNSVIRQRLSPIIVKVTNTIDVTGFSPYPSNYLQTDAIMTTAFERIRFVQQDSLYSYYNSAVDPVGSNPIYLLEPTGFRFYPITLGTAIVSYVKNPTDMSWAYKKDSNSRPVYTTGIQGANVITGGSGYSSATVTFSAPPSGGIQATGTVTLSGGVVTAIVMTNNGTGYSNTTPTMTFAGVGGTGATFSSPIVSTDPIWDIATIFDIIQRALSIIGVNLQSQAISQFAEQIKREGQ